jgi:hypothetical protein
LKIILNFINKKETKINYLIFIYLLKLGQSQQRILLEEQYALQLGYWHTYTILTSPKSIIFQIDGDLVAEFTGLQY